MKVKHGQSIEITNLLSPEAAIAFAQWIGSYTVIYNQKSRQAKESYTDWVKHGKPEDSRPVPNQQAAYLSEELPFLKTVPSQIRRNAGAKWFEAMNAAKSGLRRQPKPKAKHKKRNCYVTSELFDIQSLDNDRCLIQIKRDASKKTMGQYLAGFVLPFPKEAAGKAFYLSRKGSRFWLSMSYDAEVNALSEPEIKSLLAQMDDQALSDAVMGFDAGVKRQMTGSDGKIYHFSSSERAKIAKTEKRRVRYQRQYSRRQRTNDKALGEKRARTKGEKKLLNKLARHSEKITNIKRNRSHHISKEIAENTPLVAVVENLKLDNMTRRPNAKQDPVTGQWQRNGAKAKSGLNKAILSVNLGQIRQFAAYKLKERGKLIIKVKPHHSSQECSECGFTHPDNRKTQAEFHCLQCHHAENADDNAAKVIKKRGVVQIRSGAFSSEKTGRKKTAPRKKAQELASLECGGHVSLSTSKATAHDALNLPMSVIYSALQEARSFRGE